MKKQEYLNQNAENAGNVASFNSIPSEVYDNLPNAFIKPLSHFKDREKDIVFLSILGTLSASFPKLFGRYNYDIVGSNLYYFLIAPPASGKSKIKYAKRLIEPIHKYLFEKSSKAINEYNKLEIKKGVYQPKLEIKLLPASTSTAKVYQHFEEAKDSLLMFETEADTLSNMLKKEWADFSDILRNAYHHESISISRMEDNRYYNIEEPKLSIVISGTPNQVKPLIETKENGLFSRFIFYYFNEISDWENVSPFNPNKRGSIDTDFKGLADLVFNTYKYLDKIDSMEFIMTKIQWEKLNSEIESIYNIKRKYDTDFLSCIKRSGLILYRITMILSVIRNINKYQPDETLGLFTHVSDDEIIKNQTLECDDLDLENGIRIIKVMIEHSQEVFNLFDKNIVFLSTIEQAILLELPIEFTTEKGLDVAKKKGGSKRTFFDFLKRWTEKGIITKVSHGNYRKA
jgi:hypothetical protein